jgi:hypothetical protein
VLLGARLDAVAVVAAVVVVAVMSVLSLLVVMVMCLVLCVCVGCGTFNVFSDDVGGLFASAKVKLVFHHHHIIVLIEAILHGIRRINCESVVFSGFDEARGETFRNKCLSNFYVFEWHFLFSCFGWCVGCVGW